MTLPFVTIPLHNRTFSRRRERTWGWTQERNSEGGMDVWGLWGVTPAAVWKCLWGSGVKAKHTSAPTASSDRSPADVVVFTADRSTDTDYRQNTNSSAPEPNQHCAQWSCDCFTIELLYSSGWPRTRGPLASVLQVLQLQACITVPNMWNSQNVSRWESWFKQLSTNCVWGFKWNFILRVKMECLLVDRVMC